MVFGSEQTRAFSKFLIFLNVFKCFQNIFNILICLTSDAQRIASNEITIQRLTSGSPLVARQTPVRPISLNSVYREQWQLILH